MADDLVLDDLAALLLADPGAMLRATASSGAQIRSGLRDADRATIDAIVQAGTPRAVVVTGIGAAAICGQVLAALANVQSSIPVVAHRGHQLPAWVGARDLVIALSASGSSLETVAVAAEAARRGCLLVAITSAGSPLAQVVDATRHAWRLEVDSAGRPSRASLWALLTPLLMLGHALTICSAVDLALAQAADMVDATSQRCGVDVPVADNPAKQLGVHLAESLPVIWGTGEMGPVAAYRAIAQLAENAKLPALHGELPQSQHHQAVVLGGPFADAAVEDIFRDRADDAPRTFRLVVLRDLVEADHVARRVEIVKDIARRHGVPVTEIAAQGDHVLQRLASLITLTDWASVYAAVALHVDPTPLGPLDELHARITEDNA